MAISVSVLAEIFYAEIPPILMESKLFKLVPNIVIKVPIGPNVGLNEVMVGACAKAAFPNTNNAITISKCWIVFCKVFFI